MQRKRVVPDMAEVSSAVAPWAEVVPDAPYPMSQEQFNSWPADSWRYELIRGRLVRMPMNGGGHSLIAIKLTVAFVAQCGHLGYGLGADTGFIVQLSGEATTRRMSPDACYVRKERAPDHDDLRAWFAPWHVAPDIVAEVVSTHDKEKGVTQKAQDWLAAGVKLVWVVWPMRRRIEVWQPGDQAPSQTLGMADMLSGGAVAPFALPARDLFIF